MLTLRTTSCEDDFSNYVSDKQTWHNIVLSEPVEACRLYVELNALVSILDSKCGQKTITEIYREEA